MHDSLVTKRKGTRKSKLTISKEYKLPSREGISTYHWHNAKVCLVTFKLGTHDIINVVKFRPVVLKQTFSLKLTT